MLFIFLNTVYANRATHALTEFFLAVPSLFLRKGLRAELLDSTLKSLPHFRLSGSMGDSLDLWVLWGDCFLSERGLPHVGI